VEVSLLLSPPLGRRQREAKQKSWRLRMNEGIVDAKRIGEGSWGRRMVREQVRCQEDPERLGKVENETAISRREASGIHRIYEEQ